MAVLPDIDYMHIIYIYIHIPIYASIGRYLGNSGHLRSSFDPYAGYPNYRIKPFRMYLIPIIRSDFVNVVQFYFLAQNDFH